MNSEYIQDLRHMLDGYDDDHVKSILSGDKLWFHMYSGSMRFAEYYKLREAGIIIESPASDSRNKMWNMNEDYRDVLIIYYDIL